MTKYALINNVDWESGVFFDALLDAGSKVFHIVFVQPRHRDPPTLQQVHMVLVNQGFALLCRQAGVREHPDLVSDVLPTSRSPDALQLTPKHLTHLQNPEGYDFLQLSLPTLEQSFVVEDCSSQQGSMLGGTRVSTPDNDPKLSQ